jgi:Ca2+-binding RTX toxin-like protein
LTGDGNNNILTGAGGTNTLNGGAGNDTFIGGAGVDTFNGGGDTDTVTYSTAVTVDLENLGLASRSTGDATGDVYNIDVEAFKGSNANDIFYGRHTAKNFGDTTTEIIDASGGNDIVYGSDGADTISGGGGTDTIDYRYSTTSVNVKIGAGLIQAGGDAAGDVLSQFEIVIGSNYSDILTADNSGMTLSGLNGNDTITGGTGGDILIAGAGFDKLYGGENDDRLDFMSNNSDSNMNNDVANGEGGHDVIAMDYSKWYNTATNLYLGDTTFKADGGLGNDTLELKMSADSTLDLTKLTDNNFENFEILDLSKDASKTTVQLSAAGVQNLVDQTGAAATLTLKLGTAAGDVFQIASGEFATQSANTITFYTTAALTTQSAQVNIQYV